MRTMYFLPVLVHSLTLSAVYNVRDFGAKGDGETYDTDAVRKAAAAVSYDGGGKHTLIF